MTRYIEAEPDPILVSVERAAQMLGIKPWSVYQLLKAGELASGKYGKRRLIEVKSVREYAARLLNEASA